MNNAWFVSFLMWVHHPIDDILDDQDWIVHLVNITFVIWVVEHLINHKWHMDSKNLAFEFIPKTQVY